MKSITKTVLKNFAFWGFFSGLVKRRVNLDGANVAAKPSFLLPPPRRQPASIPTAPRYLPHRKRALPIRLQDSCDIGDELMDADEEQVPTVLPSPPPSVADAQASAAADSKTIPSKVSLTVKNLSPE